MIYFSSLQFCVFGEIKCLFQYYIAMCRDIRIGRCDTQNCKGAETWQVNRH